MQNFGRYSDEKLDEKIKEATPIVKDTEHVLSKHFDYDYSLNVYEISELSKILGADLEIFNNEDSGGGYCFESFSFRKY